jgi:hypothetical protein
VAQGPLGRYPASKSTPHQNSSTEETQPPHHTGIIALLSVGHIAPEASHAANQARFPVPSKGTLNTRPLAADTVGAAVERLNFRITHARSV